MENNQQVLDRLKKGIEQSFQGKDIRPDQASKNLDLMKLCMQQNDLSGARTGGEKVIQYLKRAEDCHGSVPEWIYKEISVMCWGEPLPQKQETRRDEPSQAGAQQKDETASGKRIINIPVKSYSTKNESSQDKKDNKNFSATYHVTGGTHPSTSLSDAPEDVTEYQKIIASKEAILKAREKELDEKEREINRLNNELEKKTNEVDGRQRIINDMELKMNQAYHENQEHLENIDKLHEEANGLNKILSDACGENSSLKQVIEHMKREQKDMEYKHDSKVRKLTGDIKSLTEQRDDLRDRFSKVAGAKLTDNNADIADLSDPNRAMKLAERFAALYDDEWTDAFQEQKDKLKRKSDKEVVQNLLQVLVDCFQFCQRIADQQMDVLNNVLLHPCQDANLDRNISGVQKGFNQPRVHSKDVKIMKEARRKIATEAINEVKEQFIARMRQDSKTDKKAMECSLTYYEKCAEICWHMVLHDPVLHLKLDVKEGDKMDLNLFTTYQSSGTVIEYLVWPPLLNGKDGGLLNKGVAQPTKNSGKPSKK